MRHQDLTLNHRLESYVFANAAARVAAGAYVSGDVGRIGYQQDNGTYWRLTATTPTWQVVPATFAGGTVGQQFRKTGSTDLDGAWKTPFAQHFTPADPTATSSATGVMMGLGLTANFTPTAPTSGRALVIASGYTSNTTAGAGSKVWLYWGSGTAPSNGAGVAGSVLDDFIIAVAAGGTSWIPFSRQAVVTGMAAGTSYWFDLILATSGGGATGMGSVVFDIVEL